MFAIDHNIYTNHEYTTQRETKDMYCIYVYVPYKTKKVDDDEISLYLREVRGGKETMPHRRKKEHHRNRKSDPESESDEERKVLGSIFVFGLLIISTACAATGPQAR